MDFLKNLASGVYNTVNKIGSTIGGVVSGVKSSLPASVSSAFGTNNLPSASSTAQFIAGQGLPGINMTAIPNITTPQGAGYADPNRNQIFITNPNTGMLDFGATSQANLTGNIRPAVSSPITGQTTTNRTDQFGRTSTREQGNPYYVGDNLIVPNSGFSGLTGSGGVGFSSVPQSGMQGESGGGGSAYTGLLSGVGTTGASALSNDEDDRLSSTQRDTKNLSQITGAAVNNITSPFNQAQFQVGKVPEVIDAEYISKAQESINQIAKSGNAFSNSDKMEILNQLAQNLITAKTKLDQQATLPENPVEDTMAQLDFVNQSEDPFGVKQALDQFKLKNTNLGNLLGTRVELMKNVQALNEAYRPIIKDIKENPDLPKALARRRLEDLATTQAETLQGFLDQLQIVTQQIDDQNQIVNRAFGIVEFAQGQANRAQDDIRAALSLMINSGGIAGFSEAQINKYANALGIPADSLRTLKEQALEPKVDIITNEDANGNLVALDKNTGKVVWSQPGFAKTSGGDSSPKLLSVSDFKNLSDQYPSAGISPSDTREVANQKIAIAGATEDIQAGFRDVSQLRNAYPMLSTLKIQELIVQNTPVSVDTQQSSGGVFGFFKGLFGR